MNRRELLAIEAAAVAAGVGLWYSPDGRGPSGEYGIRHDRDHDPYLDREKNVDPRLFAQMQQWFDANPGKTMDDFLAGDGVILLGHFTVPWFTDRYEAWKKVNA